MQKPSNKITAFVAFLLIAFFSPKKAFAFDIFPEFHSLTENEQSEFDRAFFVDAEYQSDVLAYSLPLSWDAEFATQNKAFQSAIGSLSNKIFQQDTRLKIHTDLVDRLQFRLTYFQQRDLDVDQTHFIMELVYRIAPWVKLSVYGEPSHFKRENDFGLAALLYPTANHEIRLFHTWVDFTRDRHNDREDFFLEDHDPRSMGIVGRCSGCFGYSEKMADFLEYFVRYETPTKWSFPQSNFAYAYDMTTFGASARWTPNDGATFINARLQHSNKFEGLTVTGTSTEESGSLDRTLNELQTSVELPKWKLSEISYFIEPGLGWFHRLWRDDSNDIL
ncbi:MAG TPA: hypothetical protein VM432_14365, partial [Bdellovibrionales bacterium]|nr:hypothetical protein [Bdellovibrionales bacterium]